MKKFLISVILISFAVFFIPNVVFAFGEVAGPVVFNVAAGGSNSSMWGIFNNESINVTITAQGDGAQYISFPQNVTLQAGDQIYWIPVAASIPANHNGQTNITGSLYALSQGSPGQVQINLQLKKDFYILVRENSGANQNSGSKSQGGAYSTMSQTSASSQESVVATSSSTAGSLVSTISSSQTIQNTAALQQATRFTGFLSLAQFSMIGMVLVLIVLVGLFYFLRNRRGVNK